MESAIREILCATSLLIKLLLVARPANDIRDADNEAYTYPSHLLSYCWVNLSHFIFDISMFGFLYCMSLRAYGLEILKCQLKLS